MMQTLRTQGIVLNRFRAGLSLTAKTLKRSFPLLVLSWFVIAPAYLQAQIIIDGTQQDSNSFIVPVNATSTLQVQSSDSAYTATFSHLVTVGSAGTAGTLTIRAGSGGSAEAVFDYSTLLLGTQSVTPLMLQGSPARINLTDNSATNRARLTFVMANASSMPLYRTISGTSINATTNGHGVITVRGSTVRNILLFNLPIGSTSNMIGELNIGDSNGLGHAYMYEAVNAQTINVRAGSATGQQSQHSTAVFHASDAAADVTTGTLNITANSNGHAHARFTTEHVDASRSENNNINLGTVTLDSNGSNFALLSFAGVRTGNSHTVDATINGAAAGEGTISVAGTDASFTRDIGTADPGASPSDSSNRLRLVDVSQDATMTLTGNLEALTLAVRAGSNMHSTMNLNGNRIVFAAAWLSDNGTFRGQLNFNSAPGQKRVFGTAINGVADGQGVVSFTGGNTISLAHAIGTTNRVREVHIGEGTNGGNLYAYSVVNAATINVRAGSSANQTSTAIFFSGSSTTDLTATNFNVTADATGGRALAGFDSRRDDPSRGAAVLNLGTVSLDDVTATAGGINQAILLFRGTNAQTINGTINGAASGEGTITVTTTGGVTFAGVIGGTNAIRGFNVAGQASGSVTATLNSAGTQGLGAVVLDDNSSSNLAMLTFSGTAAQTIAGTINGASAGEGVITVTNTSAVTTTAGVTTGGVTFSGLIGGTNGLRGFNVAGQASGPVTATLTSAGAQGLGAVVLDDNSSTNLAMLTFSGTAAQTIAGTINGASAGEGVITVTTTGGVTFTGAIGNTNALTALNIGSSSARGVATFNGTVAANAMTINGGATFNAVGNRVATLTLASGASIALGSAVSSGTVLTATGAITAPASGGGVTINAPNLAGGSTVTVLNGGSGTLTLTGFQTGTAAPGVALTLSITAGNDLVLTAQVPTNDLVLMGTQPFSAGQIAARLTTDTAGAVSATFTADLTITGTSMIAASGSNNAILTFDQGAISIKLGTATVDDSTGTGRATLAFTGSGAQTVTGTIDGAAAGEGTITVTNTSAVTTTAGVTTGGVTFTGAIGGTNAIRGFNVTGQASAGVTATLVTATLTSAGMHRLGAVVLDDNSSTNQAVLAFAGTSAQTIAGTISGASASEGVINVSNAAGVTFNGAIGTSSNRLRAVTVNANAAAVFSAAVNTNAMTINGGATFNAVVNANAMTINGGATFNVAGSQVATLTLGSGASITLGGGVTSGSTLIAASGAITAPTSGGGVTINAASLAVIGSTVTVLNGGSGTMNLAGFRTGTSATGVTLDLSIMNGNDLVLTAIQTPPALVYRGVGTMTVSNVTSGDSLRVEATSSAASDVTFTTELSIYGATTVQSLAANVASLTFNNAQAATIRLLGGVTLDDESSTRRATLSFVGTAAQTVIGTIGGAAAGEGVVNVSNTGGVTFSDAIGGTNAIAQFNVTGQASGSVTATLASAGAQGLGAVVLDDNSSTNLAMLTFSGSSAQTIAGTIDGAGASAGEGVITVTNTSAVTDTNGVTTGGVTFTGLIGGTNAIGQLNVRNLITDAMTNPRLTRVVINGAGTHNLGAVTLDDSDVLSSMMVVHEAIIAFGGTQAQTVTGTINGAIPGPGNRTFPGEGEISVSNTGGVTFMSAIGSTNAIREFTVTAGTVNLEGAGAQNLNRVELSASTVLNFGGSSVQSFLGSFQAATQPQQGQGAGIVRVTNPAGVTFTGNGQANNRTTDLVVVIGIDRFEVGTSANHGVATLEGFLATIGTSIVTASSSGDSVLTLHRVANSANSYVGTGFRLDDNGTNRARLVFTGVVADGYSGDAAGYAINGAAPGEGILQVLNPNRVTFGFPIGNTNRLHAIEVGSSSRRGEALFSAAVNATTLTVAATVAAPSTAIFNDAVNTNIMGATTLTVTGTATFNAAVNTNIMGATTLTVTGTATFNAAVNTSIMGATTLTVTGTADFNAALNATTITANNASRVSFDQTITANNITISASSGTTVADFNDHVTTSNVAGVALSNSSSSTASAVNASFAGDLTGTASTPVAITFTEANGTVTATFDGGAAQTVRGSIIASGNGDGAIIIANTAGAVTFTHAIGADNNRLRAMTVDASANAVFSAAVYANAMTINGRAIFNAAGNQAGTLTLGSGSSITLGSLVSSGTVLTVSGAITEPSGVVTINAPDLDIVSTVTVLDGGSGTLTEARFRVGTAAQDITLTLSVSGNDLILTSSFSGLTLTGMPPPFSTAQNVSALTTNASGAPVNATFTADLTVNGTSRIAAEGSNSATLTFDQGAAAIDLGTAIIDDSTGTGRATLVFTGSGAQTVTGTINGEVAGEGVITVTNTGGTTFNGVIGGTNAIRGFNVEAQSSGSVTATLTSAGTQGLGAVVLDDNSSTNLAMLTFSGSSAQTIAGTIDGQSAGEGVITVSNTGGVTFSDAIGGTNAIRGFNVTGQASAGVTATLTSAGTQRLGAVVLDDNSSSNLAMLTFSRSSAQTGSSAQIIAGTIDGAASGEGIVNVTNTGGVTFNDAIGGTTAIRGFNVTGQASGSVTATLTSAGAQGLGAVVLDDNSSTNLAMLTFSGSSAQTINGTIDGAASGEGVITVTNTSAVTTNGVTTGGVTFSGLIGDTNAIRGFNVTGQGSGLVTATLTSGGTHRLGAVVLDDNSDSNLAMLTFAGTAAQRFEGTLSGAATGEGIVRIINPAGVTVIGTSSNLRRIEVGDDTNRGFATFRGSFNVSNIDVRASSSGDSELTIEQVAVVAPSFGGARLFDSGNNRARLVLSGTVASTSFFTYGLINGGAAGQGVLQITGTAEIKLTNRIGSINRLYAVEVGDDSSGTGQADIETLLFAEMLTVYVNSSATFSNVVETDTFTVAGDVSSTARVTATRLLTVTGSANFGGAVNANAMTINGVTSFNAVGNQVGTLTLASGASITVGSLVSSGTVLTATGAITAPTSGGGITINAPNLAGGSTVTVLNGGSGTLTLTGFQTGRAAQDVALTLSISNGNDLVLSAQVPTNDLVLMGTPSFSAGQIAARLTTDTAGAVSATFTADLTITGTSMIEASGSNNAILTFGSGAISIKLGTATVDDSTGTGRATLAFTGSGAQTVTGTIDGAAAGEGTITVTNTGGTTFTGAIVGTTVTSSIGGTNAIRGFNVTGQASGSVTATLTSAGMHRLGAVVLDDNSSTNQAVLAFAGTSAQTIAGTISGASASEGVINVSNTGGVTFNGAIGTSANRLRAVTVNANAAAVFSAAVNTNAMTINGGGVATFNAAVNANAMTINGGATFNVARNMVGTLMLGSGATITLGSGITAGITELLDASGDITGPDSGQVMIAVPSSFTSGIIRVLRGGNTLMLSQFSVIPRIQGSSAYVLELADGGSSLIIRAIMGTHLTYRGVTTTIGSATTTGISLTVEASDSAAAMVTFTSALSINATTLVQASSNHGATLNFSGAGTHNLGPVTLDDNTSARRATLGFSGTSAQTVVNTIDGAGAAAGEGVVNVSNPAGVTFTNSIGGANGIAQFNVRANSSGAVTVTLNGAGNHNLGAVTLDDDTTARRATLAFSGTQAQTINGTINGASAGEGVITVTNTSAVTDTNGVTTGGVTFSDAVTANAITISSDAGSSSADFNGDVTTSSAAGVTITDGSSNNSATARFASNLTGTPATPATPATPVAITFTETNTGVAATFDGEEAQTVRGSIIASANGDGGITIANTDNAVTFMHVIGTNLNRLRSLTVNDDAAAVFSAAVYVNTMSISGGATFNAVDNRVQLLLLNNGASIDASITVGSAVTSGTVLTAQAVISSGTVTINAASLSAGQSVTVINSASGNLGSATYMAGPAGSGVTLTLAPNGGILTVTASSSGSTTSSSSSASPSSASQPQLPTAPGSPSTSSPSAPSAPSFASFTGMKELSSLMSGLTQTLQDGGAQSASMFEARLAGTRNQAAYPSTQGYEFTTSNADPSITGVWATSFSNSADHGGQGGNRGYKRQSDGVAIGVDQEFGAGLRAGVAMAYSSASIDGEGDDDAQFDVTSYHFGLYGDRNFADQSFIEGYVGYGYHSISGTRNVDNGVSGFGRIAGAVTSDYHADQYLARTAIGRVFDLGQDMIFTPKLNLSWMRVHAERYLESGGTGLELDVDPGAVNAMIGGVEGRLHRRLSLRGGELSTELHIGLGYDFLNERSDARAGLRSEAGRLKVQGTRAGALETTGGFGVMFKADDGWSLGANYATSYRSNEQGHTGSIDFKVRF